ncbi:gamma-glutamylcyclotransferase [Drosophila obscura]|uniref:gamma-glutamylcyclotransferase n=1 Tax=Drosophila obscura TaxID=7282 RepID=UPI001BB212EF|nr:gamma-glutamylcyclotransferase [Drosophila obscura]XP_022217583.2 gamma-glutamylcyclotransferase [Drosophila obscura]XP_022217584.2 gamma-glutamylcyclotransferase [Drosophila obscura]XP_022217585.2 gamma-glutamylcyclotransferase [Drosophila obscura]XP_022217586.2 gamma-glutamylcyclotransferase [Drosophila obscura]XP_022217587.2 gamma-glutamylcyclotransferase [Drosophila obscura]
MACKFYYFGFGSNMLARRIHIQNPTAKRIGAGKLENYRLDFHTGSKNWLGAPATIVPTAGAHVYGAIWEIDMCNLKDLDDQESVPDGLYIPISVPVLSLTSNTDIICRAYHLTNQPHMEVHRQSVPPPSIPLNRQPSQTYLKVLVKGAQETGIPEDYVKWLKSLKHNGNQVETMEEKLELDKVQLS